MEQLPDIAVTVHSGEWDARIPRAEELCRRAAGAALADAASRLPPGRPAELSIVLADDRLLRDLNRDYRHRDKPTNVLSFPSGFLDGEGDPGEGPFTLGDVVIALSTLAREAAAQGKSNEDHLAHLVVHGVLHLLGYDHETERDAREMERVEARVLAGLGVADPYEGRATRATA
jgi:probable rRNA maturation factor